ATISRSAGSSPPGVGTGYVTKEESVIDSWCGFTGLGYAYTLASIGSVLGYATVGQIVFYRSSNSGRLLTMLRFIKIRNFLYSTFPNSAGHRKGFILPST
ncbi:hypothetical protein A2U01_0055171, partial [Trifolium medium]|nr:hypothetical protein [Trifolium medium]